jgi:AraC-like DNA-binding protein
MDFTCDERLSDSPFVERVWRSYSVQSGNFISMADVHWGIVITRSKGKITVTIRGPETKASTAYCIPDAEFIGIQFKPGTIMPNFPAKMLMDRQDVNLPDANSQSFYLNGSAWQLFDYENADSFVKKLTREGLLLHDPVIDATLQGQIPDVSLRTVQRRFLNATGQTNTLIFQINRARQAAALLKEGVSILDTVEQTGFFDQSHLTNSLKTYVGQTPAQILSENRPDPLSFLYQTEPILGNMMQVYS